MNNWRGRNINSAIKNVYGYILGGHRIYFQKLLTALKPVIIEIHMYIFLTSHQRHKAIYVSLNVTAQPPNYPDSCVTNYSICIV